MSRFSFVDRRVRGFRVVDVAALGIVLTLALAVYALKASAGRQTGDIATLEDQIHDQSREVRGLQAEIAHLESPDRLERLARRYGNQAPVTARQEITPDALPQIAAAPPQPSPAASNSVTP